MPKSERMAEPDAWGALLAGEVLVQSGQHENPAPRNRPKLERVRSWQLALLTDGPRTLPLAECVLAGRNLAAMGDPRPEVMTLDGMPFCVVPAGPFMMGEGEKPSRQGPVHRVDLPQVFAIGRWPVSTEQWREFVLATGHKVKDSNSLAGPGNQPANCIDWAEALRLCDYLTERWRSVLPPGWAVTLPSEAEWEKAARGGELIPATPTSVRVKQLPDALLQPQVLGENPWPTREFPWWQGFDGQPINTDNIIGDPSALGLGASCPSPYGCEEMAGNVWEWTRSLYSEALLEPAFGYPYDNTDSTRETLDSLERSRRIVRGGSWASTHGLARCACRGNLHPDDRDGGLGFRVVLRSPPVL